MQIKRIQLPELVERLVGGHRIEAGGIPEVYDVDGIPIALSTLPASGPEGMPLVFAFHGAIDQRKHAMPAFEGARFRNRTEGKAVLLLIADPALSLDRAIGSAWYAGYTGFDVPAVLSKIFSTLRDGLGASRVIFTGGSVGGHPALYHSIRMSGSVCIAQNPIACISNYRPRLVQYFRKVCWPDLAPDTPLSDVIQDDVGLLYGAGHDNNVVYLQNATDHHFHAQAARFLSKISTGDKFLFCSEFFGSHRGHTYPVQRLANWVQAAVDAPTANVLDIAAVAESLNRRLESPQAPAPSSSPAKDWDPADIITARQIANLYAT